MIFKNAKLIHLESFFLRFFVREREHFFTYQKCHNIRTFSRNSLDAVNNEDHNTQQDQDGKKYGESNYPNRNSRISNLGLEKEKKFE